MEIHRMSPDNRIIIVDEENFDRIEKLAKLKEEEIKSLAHEEYLKFISESGISMSISINNESGVLRGRIITELNYDERGYPCSITDEIKYSIVDDMTAYINKKFMHYKYEYKKILKDEWEGLERKHNNTIKTYQLLLFIAGIVIVIISIFPPN